MLTVELKGVHSVRSKGRLYHYAWRGGPRLTGSPGSPEFMASYYEAYEQRHAPDESKFRSVVDRYKNSNDYKGLSDATRKNWDPWLERISNHFGDLSTRQFNRTLPIRKIIIKWRKKYESKPRTADFGMQVLSRVISYGIDPLTEIQSNACKGIKHLFKDGSRAEIIWTDDDLADFKQSCSPEMGYAVDLDALTGFRRSDLVRVGWAHVQQNAIVIKTGKSRQRTEAIVPLYRELRELLDRIPRRAPQILTNTRGEPWTGGGLESSFQEARAKAWPNGKNLRIHDLRGTAATKIYLAGFTEREIAEVLGWDEETVKRIIRRYVSRNAAIAERVRKLDAAGTAV